MVSVHDVYHKMQCLQHQTRCHETHLPAGIPLLLLKHHLSSLAFKNKTTTCQSDKENLNECITVIVVLFFDFRKLEDNVHLRDTVNCPLLKKKKLKLYFLTKANYIVFLYRLVATKEIQSSQ